MTERHVRYDRGDLDALLSTLVGHTLPASTLKRYLDEYERTHTVEPVHNGTSAADGTGAGCCCGRRRPCGGPHDCAMV